MTTYDLSPAAWFAGQLKASGEGFVWAVQQVPEARRWQQPPSVYGEWSAARLAYHMWNYERNLALPGMRQWLGGAGQTRQQLMMWQREDQEWQREGDLDAILERFEQVRAEQVALLTEFEAAHWEQAQTTLWGQVTLKWVVAKTWQHTQEHTTTVMQIALFW